MVNECRRAARVLASLRVVRYTVAVLVLGSTVGLAPWAPAARALAAPALSVKIVDMVFTTPFIGITGSKFTKNGQVAVEVDQGGVFGDLTQYFTLKANGSGAISDIGEELNVSAACFALVVATDLKTGVSSNIVRVNEPGCVPPTLTADLVQSTGGPGFYITGKHFTPYQSAYAEINEDVLDGKVLTYTRTTSDQNGNFVLTVFNVGNAVCGHKVVVWAVDDVSGAEPKPVTVQTKTCP